MSVEAGTRERLQNIIPSCVFRASTVCHPETVWYGLVVLYNVDLIWISGDVWKLAGLSSVIHVYKENEVRTGVELSDHPSTFAWIEEVEGGMQR